jgi:soluble lytic murein transglycosylase-like protein
MIAAPLLALALMGAPATDPADALRAQLRAERAAHRIERRRLAGMVRERDRRIRSMRASSGGVDHALRLAATATGVPLGQLRSVARCESGLSATARNRFSGASGLLQFLPSTWLSTPFGRAGWSVMDAHANAMAAAQIVAREGWRQWECRP